MVVVLHGCTQSAAKVAEQSGWNVLADKHGFVVIYPEQKFSNNTSGCFNWFYSKDIDPKSGERFKIFFDELLEQGIYVGPSSYEVGFISSAHSNEDLKKAAGAMKSALAKAYA